MKQDKTLLKIVQKLQRKELIRYASNLLVVLSII